MFLYFFSLGLLHLTCHVTLTLLLDLDLDGGFFSYYLMLEELLYALLVMSLCSSGLDMLNVLVESQREESGLCRNNVEALGQLIVKSHGNDDKQ